jgi:hypothetical protein
LLQVERPEIVEAQDPAPLGRVNVQVEDPVLLGLELGTGEVLHVSGCWNRMPASCRTRHSWLRLPEGRIAVCTTQSRRLVRLRT